MSSGFQVTRSGLYDAAATFTTEAGTFKAIMPQDGPPPPDGGDAAFNDSLRSVVQGLGLLHLQFAGELDNHATRLTQSSDTYAAAEQDIIHQIRQITTGPVPAG